MPNRTGYPSCSSIMRPYILRNCTQDIPIMALTDYVRTKRPAPSTTIHAGITFLIRDLAGDGWILERHRKGRFSVLRLRRASGPRPQQIAPYQNAEHIRARFYGNLQPRYGR